MKRLETSIITERTAMAFGWCMLGATSDNKQTNKQTNKAKQNKQRFSVTAAFRCELCVKTITKMRNDFDRPLHMNSADYGFGNISADPACIWELLLMFVRKPGPFKLVDALLFEGQTLCRISVSQLKLRQIICNMVARVSCHPSTTTLFFFL